jgi:hypothetical protein
LAPGGMISGSVCGVSTVDVGAFCIMRSQNSWPVSCGIHAAEEQPSRRHEAG